MDLEQRIEEIVENQLPGNQYFITGIRAKPGGAKTKVSVFLDGDHGIDIGICAEISKQLGRRIEELQLINGPYTLEVSSPGLDTPLKLPRQYHKNIGKNIRVLLEDGQFEGILEEVSDDYIIVKETKEKKTSLTRKVAFSDIIKTHVLVSF